MTNDLVIHPNHYNKDGRKECWDEMIEKFSPEATIIFDCMSAYKYYYRAGEKENNPEEQDLAKIKNYFNHSCQILADYKIPYNSLARKVYNDAYKEIFGND